MTARDLALDESRLFPRRAICTASANDARNIFSLEKNIGNDVERESSSVLR